MATIQSGNQQFYTGKKPLDSKALVQTFADLLDANTWLNNDGEIAAYNGMLTAVWLDKVDSVLSDKNGIYLLFDPTVTSTRKATPDVTKEENWHKLVEIDDLTEKLAAIDERLTALEEDSDVITYGYRKDFPSVGEVNKMYVAADEGKTYIWFNDDYLFVGGGDYEEPTMIYGGDSGI
jgi:hypothetical protein